MKKTGLWLAVGLAVIILEIGISYFVVTTFISPSAEAGSRGNSGSMPEVRIDDYSGSDTTESGEVFTIPHQYTIADFVINPANSRGEHFFVVTIVFGLASENLRSRMEARDVILRDKLLGTLGSKTYRWYSDKENMSVLRGIITEIAEEVLQVNGGVTVYFNKYVTQ